MTAHKNMVRMPKQHDSTQEQPYYYTTAALLQWDTNYTVSEHTANFSADGQ